MTYTPPVVRGKYDGPSGIAKIKVNTDKTKVQVLMKDPPVKAVIDAKKCPGEIAPPSGTWMVGLTRDKDEIHQIRPVNGLFDAKVKEYPAPEGQDPKPKTKNVSYDGNSWSYEYFIVLLELTGEDVAGMVIPLMLRYHFGMAEQEIKGAMREVAAFTSPKSKYTPMLVDFCDLTGVWEYGPIPYKDNILPDLEKRQLQANKEFQIVMKDGWVLNLLGKTDLDEEEAPWDEEEGKMSGKDVLAFLGEESLRHAGDDWEDK